MEIFGFIIVHSTFDSTEASTMVMNKIDGILNFPIPRLFKNCVVWLVVEWRNETGKGPDPGSRSA